MDPRHLHQLAVILEKGSITAASQHLDVTQPTLTRNMATLEMQAGTQLFSRSRFGVRPTAVGEALAREGRLIARSMQSAREQLSRYNLGLKDQLRIGVGPLIGMALFPELLARLLQENPRLALTLTTMRPNIVLEQLIDGQQDAVIAPAAINHAPPGIVRLDLISDSVAVYCGPTHPLAGATKIRTKDLDAADWLSVGMASTFEREMLEKLTDGGLKRMHTQLASVGDAVVLLTLLSFGRHLALLPRTPMRLLRGRLDLVELPVPGVATQRDIYLWCRESVLRDPAFVTFRETTMDHLAQRLQADEGEPHLAKAAAP